MKIEFSPDEARFIVAAMEAIRVQNKAGLQIKHAIVGKLLSVLPDEQDQAVNGPANIRV